VAGAPPTPILEMPEEMVTGLEAYLGLLAKMVHVGEVEHTRQRVYTLRETYGSEYTASGFPLMFPLEPLLRLYCCRIQPTLRACILDTVRQCATPQLLLSHVRIVVE